MVTQVKFNGIARLYDAYSWRLTRRAKRVWRSGNVLQGPELENLEKAFCKKYKRKYAVGVGSATDGLYFAMRALQLNKGSTIICPALSYIATAGAVRRLGAKLNFADVDAQGNLGDLQSQQKPQAIVYVNLYGNTADYARIRKYCDENKAYLIEDAAQSQGASIGSWPNKKLSGQLGDVSVFSFDPTKNLPSFGSGGMVLTDSQDVYERLLSLRRHGLQGKRIPYGYNSLISEDHAAQLNLLLDKFDSLQARRTKIAERYFKNLPYEEFVRANKDTASSYHKLVILHNRRDELQKYLATHGIETKIHYTKPLDTVGSHPVAEKICKRALSLPIYPYLSLSEVDYVCERINDFNGV